MLTKEECKAIVESDLMAEQARTGSDLELVIVEDATIEKGWGWVFFYQSGEYLRTGDLNHLLGGNAPYLVNKLSGEFIISGTSEDIEYYIKEYEQHLAAGA